MIQQVAFSAPILASSKSACGKNSASAAPTQASEPMMCGGCGCCEVAEAADKCCCCSDAQQDSLKTKAHDDRESCCSAQTASSEYSNEDFDRAVAGADESNVLNPANRGRCRCAQGTSNAPPLNHRNSGQNERIASSNFVCAGVSIRPTNLSASRTELAHSLQPVVDHFSQRVFCVWHL